MKLLKAAIENRRWDVAAHALVVGMVRAEQKEQKGQKEGGDGRKKRSARKPKSSENS